MKSLVGKRLSPPTIRKLRAAVEYPGIYRRLVANYFYDLNRFLDWSSVATPPEKRDQLRAWIDADFHKIEKALALKAPRPGFGKVVVRRLLENLKTYQTRFGADWSTDVAVNVLYAYQEFGRQHGSEDEELEGELAILQRSCESELGGVKTITAEEIRRSAQIDLEEFFFSRHSIRHFGEGEVDPKLIERAVHLASKTPTVCNRQSLKVYSYADPVDRARVVECQKGNSGFGDQIKVALVVTSDTSTFFAVGERNQGWIDGGLFSMSLVYALHSLGLGSCCLNWSVEKEEDQALRRVTGIPESEIVIMMIGVGHLPASLRVAQSPRKATGALLINGTTHVPS